MIMRFSAAMWIAVAALALSAAGTAVAAPPACSTGDTSLEFVGVGYSIMPSLNNSKGSSSGGSSDCLWGGAGNSAWYIDCMQKWKVSSIRQNYVPCFEVVL
jgi:hypothetical protein